MLKICTQPKGNVCHFYSVKLPWLYECRKLAASKPAHFIQNLQTYNQCLLCVEFTSLQ